MYTYCETFQVQVFLITDLLMNVKICFFLVNLRYMFSLLIPYPAVKKIKLRHILLNWILKSESLSTGIIPGKLCKNLMVSAKASINHDFVILIV